MVELRRRLQALADAAESLAGAARLVVDLIPRSAGEEGPGRAGVPAWTSPTRSAEPVVVRGEEDLLDALQRGNPALVIEGPGGFPGGALEPEERIRLLARRLVGDVALEVRHAGIGHDGRMVDGMLADALRLLQLDAVDAGQGVPQALFVAAAQEFTELDARGAAWR